MSEDNDKDQEPDRESLVESVGLPDELLDDQNMVIVVALAEGASYGEAALRAGVSAKTVQRRMKIPAFAAVVHQRRAERFAQLAGLLASRAAEAVDVIRDVMADGSDTERLKAARMALDYSARFHTRHLLEVSLNERLNALAHHLYLDTDPMEWD